MEVKHDEGNSDFSPEEKELNERYGVDRFHSICSHNEGVVYIFKMGWQHGISTPSPDYCRELGKVYGVHAGYIRKEDS